MRTRMGILCVAVAVVGVQLVPAVAEAGTFTLKLSASTYSKSESGSTVRITVERTGTLSGSTRVDYATSNGTALAGSDYTAKSGTLELPSMAASKSVDVSITNDSSNEGDQTFTFKISNNLNIGSPRSATVTIQDDDMFVNWDEVYVSISVPESAGPDLMDIDLTDTANGTRDAIYDHEVTVSVVPADGSALVDSDYIATSGSETFSTDAFSNPPTYPVNIVDDDISEGTETFTVTLSSVVGGQLGARSVATITIIDDDAPAQTLAFSSATASVSEGVGSANLTVTRSGGSTGTVTVSYATGGGSATSGSDFSSTSGTLTFTSGQTTKTISVPITNDSTTESSESFTVSLSSPSGATLGSPSSSTVTIVDDDGTSTVLGFSTSTYSVTEAGTSATITVTRSGSTSGSKQVDYTTNNGTATAGSDYTAAVGTLTFGGGETTKTFEVLISDDQSVEGDETVNITLTNPTGGATLGTSTAVLTITDDDSAPLPVTHARSVSLRLRKHLVAKGTVTVADSIGDCFKKVTVKIQRKKSGSWKTIDKTLTDNQGRFRTWIPDKTRKHRAKVAEITLDNGDLCALDKSGTKRHQH